MKHVFSTFEVCKILDIKVDRLKDYTTRGYIVPSVQHANGHAVKSLFDRADIVRLKAFMRLVEFGLSRKKAAELIDLIKIDFEAELIDLIEIDFEERE